jgi:hypothetical protein
MEEKNKNKILYLVTKKLSNKSDKNAVIEFIKNGDSVIDDYNDEMSRILIKSLLEILSEDQKRELHMEICMAEGDNYERMGLEKTLVVLLLYKPFEKFLKNTQF